MVKMAKMFKTLIKMSALKLPPSFKKKVTFSDVVTYFNVPGHEEDRRGTWKVDNNRFLKRIKSFEQILLSNRIDRPTSIENNHALLHISQIV